MQLSIIVIKPAVDLHREFDNCFFQIPIYEYQAGSFRSARLRHIFDITVYPDHSFSHSAPVVRIGRVFTDPVAPSSTPNEFHICR